MDALTVEMNNIHWDKPQAWTNIPGQPKELKTWQSDAYERLKKDRFALIAAFCGSGKSILQVALAIYDIVKSGYKQKQLFVVPQSHIHQGFTGDNKNDYIDIKIEDKNYNWRVIDNFCNEHKTGILKELKKWLLTEVKAPKDKQIITGLNAVVSHQALALVWNKLSDDEKERATKNLTLRVDEAHHIRGVCDTGDNIPEDVVETNNLGKICNYILNSEDDTSKLHLSTATPYRGDKQDILSSRISQKFSTYYLDWVEHFNTLGIENFRLEYEEYKDKNTLFAQILEKIRKEPEEKHMIVIPSTANKWRKNKNDYKKFLDALCTIVRRERILDLVTPNTQKRNKKLLLEEPKSGDRELSKYDVVVTCMLGREGTDWCPCSRLHNTAHEKSITLAIQTMGRAFRSFEGKRLVKIFYYVPEFVTPKAGMTKRELLSDRSNALLVCMQLNEQFYPILVPVFKYRNNNKIAGVLQRVTLEQIFNGQYQKVKTKMLENLSALQIINNKKISYIIEELLRNHKGWQKSGAEKKQVYRALFSVARKILMPELRKEGLDLSQIRLDGFDKIIEDQNTQYSNIFFGEYNKADWEIIRGIFKKHFSLKEQIANFNACQKARELKRATINLDTNSCSVI